MNGIPNRCPDGGTCHHSCESFCFRVDHTGPLSGVFPNDEWPVGIGPVKGVVDRCSFCGGESLEPFGDDGTLICPDCGAGGPDHDDAVAHFGSSVTAPTETSTTLDSRSTREIK